MSETGTETMTEGAADAAQPEQSTAQDTQNAAPMLTQGKDNAANNDWQLDANNFKDIDPVLIDSYSSLAKKYGMSHENASSLLKDAAEILNRMDVENVQRQSAAWIEASRNDKEFGGAALNANLAIAKKALDAYGSPELRDFLETTGLGNHPAVIRLFFRVGKTLAEDGTVIGAAGISGVKTFEDAARRLYGNP